MAFSTTDLLSRLNVALTAFTGLRSPTQARSLELTLLRSHHRRTHSLVPWASDIKRNKIYVQDLLLVASEAADSSEPTVVQAAAVAVPVYALEASLFTFPATNIALLYISKVDTTGLLDRPSLAKTLTATFIACFLQQQHGNSMDLRVHIFARAADQYLFPGSVDNKGKKVLTDKQLCAWWRSVLALAALDASKTAAGSDGRKLAGWLFFPGLEEVEGRRLAGAALSSSSSVASEAALSWSYGHPYETLRPLCSTSSDTSRLLGDLIPALPDDPKSRFLTSLTSSPMSAAGETGDYEDAHLSSSGAAGDAQLEEQRKLERTRLNAVEGGTAEYWERLAWRQECCSGALVGFFVLASTSLEPGEPRQEASAPVNEIDSLSRAVYTKLWNTIHNLNYAADPKPRTTVPSGSPSKPTTATLQTITRLAAQYQDWLAQIAAAHVSNDSGCTADAYRTLLTLPKYEGEKRKVEEEKPKVNVMQIKPRKKPKPAAS